MPTRSYGQYCAIAKALDVVGERWALLVVRELLDGPLRYKDLHARLHTISTDMLARRLRDLEAAGLLRRTTLPPPASSQVYELTPDGRDLEPALSALGRWGMRLLGERDDEIAEPRWLARAVRTLLRTDRPAVDLLVRFDTPEGTVTLRIDRDVVELTDADRAPDVVLAGGIDDLAAATDPGRAMELREAGRIRVEGSPEAIGAFVSLLRPDAATAERRSPPLR